MGRTLAPPPTTTAGAGSPGVRQWDVAAVAVVVAVLALRNLAGEAVPSALYVPVNLGVTAVLALVARSAGLSAGDVGLSRSAVAAGLRVGGVGAILVVAVIAVGAGLPLTRPLFEDQRVAGVDGAAELAYQAAVRIPLGTVVLEEVAFRGVLLALLARHHPRWVAAGTSSFLFGLWHVRPTVSALEANDLAAGLAARAAAVAGAVVATALAGLAFCALRMAARSLLAPVLVHTATNSASLVAAHAVLGAS